MAEPTPPMSGDIPPLSRDDQDLLDDWRIGDILDRFMISVQDMLVWRDSDGQRMWDSLLKCDAPRIDELWPRLAQSLPQLAEPWATNSRWRFLIACAASAWWRSLVGQEQANILAMTDELEKDLRRAMNSPPVAKLCPRCGQVAEFWRVEERAEQNVPTDHLAPHSPQTEAPAS